MERSINPCSQPTSRCLITWPSKAWHWSGARPRFVLDPAGRSAAVCEDCNMAGSGKRRILAVWRRYNEAHFIAVTRGRLHRPWAAFVLSCPIIMLLILTGTINSIWLELRGLVFIALKVVTIPKAVAVYRRRS